MRYVKLPPPRIPKTETVCPTLMVGKCIFGARGKLSLIRVNNRPAEDKIIGVLASQLLSGNPSTPDSLGISAEKLEGKQIVFYGSIENSARDWAAILEAGGKEAIEKNIAKLQICHFEEIGLGGQLKAVKAILTGYPKTHTLIITFNNYSRVLPDDTLMASDYLAKLKGLAISQKASIIIIFNQWNGTEKPKNGPFKGVADKYFFSIAKLSYTSHPDSYYLEAYRAPRGHDFWPISVSSDEFGNPVHVGIERNRVPFK